MLCRMQIGCQETAWTGTCSAGSPPAWAAAEHSQQQQPLCACLPAPGQLTQDSPSALSAMSPLSPVGGRAPHLGCRPSDCYGLGTAQGSVLRPDLHSIPALSRALLCPLGSVSWKQTTYPGKGALNQPCSLNDCACVCPSLVGVAHQSKLSSVYSAKPQWIYGLSAQCCSLWQPTSRLAIPYQTLQCSGLKITAGDSPHSSSPHSSSRRR